jgi:hypothetical protein
VAVVLLVFALTPNWRLRGERKAIVMNRVVFWVLLTGTAAMAAEVPAAHPRTFYKDVLPILQKNCQSCHRPGQIAPMAFLDYESVRPWAKAMKTAVVTRKMPPWNANPAYGHFTNDRSLKDTEIQALVEWSDSGAPEGNRKDAPPPVRWPDAGWTVQPDHIVTLPDYEVPAKGIVEWTNITIPGGFAQDTWVSTIEILPSTPAVVHHMCVYFKPHTANVKYFEREWLDIKRDEDGNAIVAPNTKSVPFSPRQQTDGTNGIEYCYLPGNPVDDYRLEHAAKFVKAGTDIVVNLHYTPTGKSVVDKTKIGFTFAKQAPERQFVTVSQTASTDPAIFAIPPRDSNWKSPSVDMTFLVDAKLVWMMPHMHLRGKDMTYTLTYPDGRSEVILDVPHYDFNWQIGYHTSIEVPKGTKLHVDAHYDNSANNPFNPNPDKTVYFGGQTWEEMMSPFLAVTVDKGIDPRKVTNYRGKTGGG